MNLDNLSKFSIYSFRFNANLSLACMFFGVVMRNFPE